MRRPTAGATLLALIAVAGCGGGDESSPPDPFTKVEQRQGVRDARAAATASTSRARPATLGRC